MYNISCHRDPVGLVALVANKSDCFPEGLTLGPADDVYGLGTCVVRALTMLLDLPNEWGMFDFMATWRRFAAKLSVLVEILRCNPAWDPFFFTDLHQKMRPKSSKPEDMRTFEASARAIEIRLQGVDTLYSQFLIT